MTSNSFHGAALPLHERTNSAAEVSSSFPVCARQQPVTRAPESSFHTLFLRDLSHTFHSSDTLPSAHDSIYNAEVASADDNRSAREWSNNVDATYPGSLSNAQESAEAGNDSNFNRSCDWTKRQPRKISSVPRLQQSPARTLKVLRPQVSQNSVQPFRDKYTSPAVTSSGTSPHIRSFSLNDLDCFPKSDTGQALYGLSGHSSSSSQEALRSIRMCPKFPVKPVHPPPYRRPTPPGIPSFGTREAQEIRLTLASPPNKALLLLRRLLGRSRDETGEQLREAANEEGPIASVNTNDPSTNPPVNMLRRALGISNPIPYQTTRDARPRSPLPPGIRIAAFPGPLIQAEDGTMIRGRWGTRTSAHGVGQRRLDAHPLARVEGLRSIDEAIREIDKACELSDEEDRSRQMVGTRSIEGMLASSMNQEMTVEGSGRDLERPIQSPPDLGSLYSSLFDIENLRVRPRVVSSLNCSRTRTTSRVTPPQTMRMDEPRRYGVTSPLSSMTQDSVAGFRNYVEQCEREHVRQSLENRKKDGSGCKQCWEGFWMFCCSPSGRSHQNEGSLSVC